MHLTDCFMPLVAYVTYFQQNAASTQPPFEQVKGDVRRLLSDSESNVMKTVFSHEDYDSARFAICAWVDEAILASSWNHKNLWQREQLQRLYYNTTDAGEEFFDRLNSLEFHKREVREVFYLCLALGFKGRFVHRGDEYLLEQLKTSNLKLLLGSSVGLPSIDREELFPEAYPTQVVSLMPRRRAWRFSAFNILFLVGPVLLFSVLYLIYHFVLNGITENFLRAGS